MVGGRERWFLGSASLTATVGGEILDMALARAKPHARFVMCGGKSELLCLACHHVARPC